jgi:quinol---cytochrome c reductase cytochrome c subunit, bacillus type
MSRAQDERRAQFARYKRDVEERGKAFYPYAMFHDTVMSFVVVCVIVGLAVVWKFTAGETPEDPGVLGVLYAEEADPGTTSFIPRPDWYFYFLFYLLRIFKWPDSVILGTIGIPTILLIVLIALPFIDRRPERRLLRRPVAIVAVVITAVSMGVLTYKGATVRESLSAIEDVPVWIEQNNLPEDVRPGAELVAGLGCLQCHTYLDSGSANVGAPPLEDIGAQEGRTVDYFQRYVANPREFDNNIMPVYESQGEEKLRQIAEFLVASKGGG